ncbi:MAG: alpha-galactosidase [Alkalibacterium sp.]|uniref:alpha-galactosidase n=1 Tax=Alkalibacterium sp. TaxID=1872447 RepID=UPI0039707BDD
MPDNKNLIYVNEDKLEFHLTNQEVSYIFRVFEKSKQPEHLYFGKSIQNRPSFDFLIEREPRSSINLNEKDYTSSLEHTKQEYPGFGTTDFRYPAFELEYPEGDRISNFAYDSYVIHEGKPKLEGLPATYTDSAGEAQTLEVILRDAHSNLLISLFYSIFETRSLITRSVKFHNEGKEIVKLNHAMSMSIDFPDDDFDMIHLNGAWARENHVERQPLFKGVQSISSARGASSHMHNPFFALVRPETTERQGDVYGFSLVYSGNHLGQVEVDTYNVTRATMGINPYQFQWKLKPDEAFQTPEVVMVYSATGINGMSQTYHDLYRNRLAREPWKNQTRPILINNWEATYFDFTEDKIMEIAEKAKEAGVELFVLDDGWFGERNDDSSSLGNWTENKVKLPDGIAGLSDKIHKLGLKFGLWFEPEMINKDTPLYQEHPEWVIRMPAKPISYGRNQFVLDFSNPEVVDALFNQMDAILTHGKIDYIKWDMNRYITEPFSTLLPHDRQGELYHRYILGVYSLYERLLDRYPDLLIESCAGGGGRFDPGLLYYAPQAWTSDDTDAVERLKIQYGTSLVYPLSSLGSHVSAVPNHQMGRTTSLDMRSAVAYFGTFGYELDVTKLSEDEMNQIKAQISFFKDNRRLIHEGIFYRLKSPFEGNETAWMVVSQDRKEALIGFYQVLAQPNPSYSRLKLAGLEEDTLYTIDPDGEERYGSDLNTIGLLFSENERQRGHFWSINGKSDFHSWIVKLTAKE